MVISRIGLAALTFAALASAPVSAQKARPSFDCAKAATSVEKLICAEPDIARLDRLMAGIHKRAVASLDGNKKLVRDHKHWLGTRKDCIAGDHAAQVDCLRNSYKDHIAYLAPAVETDGPVIWEGTYHYVRKNLSGELKITKAADGTYSITGATVANNSTAHNCGIELEKGVLNDATLNWNDEISECKVKMGRIGDSLLVEYECVGGANPNCGLSAAWDRLWVRAPD